MNGFGYDPMGMYPNSPYNYNNMQNQEENMQPDQEGMGFVEALRTTVSGLSAITGVSYGVGILFHVAMKTLKLFKSFFKGKESKHILDSVWQQSVNRQRTKGILAVVKYFLVGFILVANVFLYVLFKKKQAEAEKQRQLEEEEEKRLVEEEAKKDEISLDDFKLFKKQSKTVVSLFFHFTL
jgi:hypothetical protein